MPHKRDIIIVSLIVAGTYYLYRKLMERRRENYKLEIKQLIRTEKYHQAIKMLLNLWKTEESNDVREMLLRCYYMLGEYASTLEYANNDSKLLIDINFKLKNFREALFHSVKLYENTKDEKVKEEIISILLICVNEEIKITKVKKISKIFYKEFFETFPLLFKDFKDNYIEDYEFTANKISKEVYETVRKCFDGDNYIALKIYTMDLNDNLSLFIKISLSIIECDNKFISRDLLLFDSQYINDYERKIFTYCNTLLDYKESKINDYNFDDVSTYYYKMVANPEFEKLYVDKLIKCGIYSFVYYHFIRSNPFLIEETLKLFKCDPKILSYTFEYYIYSQNYEGAENILENMLRNCKDDPRTYLCLYYKNKLRDNNDDITILEKAYKIDPLFYKVNMLLGQYYLSNDINKADYYLRSAKDCCNSEEDLRKIIETDILFEIQKGLAN